MKKFILCFAVLFFAACSEQSSNNPSTTDDNTIVIPIDVPVIEGYINLGLPSGTQWKDKNESGYYEYYDALEHFSTQLPTSVQIKELIEECTWSWNGSGYTVTGPNGNSITLPAQGYMSISDFPKRNETLKYYGEVGYYWTSTHNDDYYGVHLYIGKSLYSTSANAGPEGWGYSVRLCTEPLVVIVKTEN